ncbi:MAG: hypothetical protein OXG15_09785 [Gammaproteobacteria bacterium]|nr:hypothetical protein [Gammaproteobacteria bacterium]
MTIEWWHALIAASMLIGVGVWVVKVETSQKNFRQFMEEIRNDIKEIFIRLPAKPLSETSQLALTDKGRKMLAEIEGERWALELATTLTGKVDDMDEYQIQEFCFGFVGSLDLTDEQDARIRKCAYENASDKEETLIVLAVELRDVLLEKIGKAPMP